jgi:hypothetical protein
MGGRERAAALALLAATTTCGATPSPSASPSPRARTGAGAEGAPTFLKGQLHAHTSASGDSHTPASAAAEWYAQHGFDFVVFTDHNRVTEVDPPPGDPPMLVFRGVELTQNLMDCSPPPAPHEACLLHVNALFVGDDARWIFFGAPGSRARVDLYGRAVDRAIALGGVAQLNHPNFQGGADAEVLYAAVQRGVTLVEIANEAVDSRNDGGHGRPSTEELWDAVLTRGARVFGTATDDAHHYDDAPRRRARGEVVYTGDRGFVMVRAARSEASIRAAIAAGDFYASTGVLLDRLEMSPRAIAIDVRQDGLGAFGFDVIANGKTVEHVEGLSLRLDPRRYAPGYVRVRVGDGARRHAWTQPVWL